MMDKCILHIGAPKTGTKSIQYFLYRNRDLLRDKGYLVPNIDGRPNHTFLAVSFANQHHSAGLIREHGLGDHRHRLRYAAHRRERLREMVAESPASTLMLSNEHCFSHLISIDEIKRLRDLLSEFCRHVEVLIYFRRQDKVAVSLMTTKIKTGDVVDFRFQSLIHRFPNHFDYFVSYDRYATVFGKENLRPKIFEKDHLTAGSLLLSVLDC